MDLNLLDSLKDQLVKAKDFHKVYEFFLDNFGENSEFMVLGDRARHPMLETVYAQVLEQLFKRKIDTSALLLTRIPDQEFLHGGGMFHGHLATVFYFEDVHAGLIAVASPLEANTRFIRFSLKGMRGNVEPSVN